MVRQRRDQRIVRSTLAGAAARVALRAGLLAIGLLGFLPRTSAQVAPGDIVETAINYQPVTGEVLRSYGNMADLNLGQNNIGRYLEVQYMKVVQKAGTGGTSPYGLGDTVQRNDRGNLVTGRIMKTNGAYCEIDSSGSGFTGWGKCSQLKLVAKASPAAAQSAATAAGIGTAVLVISSEFAPSAGAPNPAANHGFYLLRDSVEVALSKGGFHTPAGQHPVKAMNTACEQKSPECQTAVAAIISDSASAVKTDANGNASVPAVAPGVYYLFGIGKLEGKALVWNVRVSTKAGQNSLKLSRENGTLVE